MNKDKGPRSRVELILSASSLADRDLFSRSDPICVVSQLEDGTWQSGRRNYVEVGRTERIKNCLNPRWNQKILMNYFFESKQSIRFEMYDIDSHSKTLTDHDFLGRAECELAQIVAAPGGRITLPVHHAGSQCGTLTVAAEELDEGQKETVNFVCHGRGLDKKDFFGKSDPFLEFYRILEDGSRQMVHRTEVIKKTVNPEWKPFEMTVRHLCENNKDREFIIECYDYDSDGSLSHDFIGSCQLSLNALTAKRENNFPLINEKKQKKKGAKYKDSGVLHFLHVDVRKEYTFLDFVTSGMQLEFAVAVDFTSSNGPVHSTTSLHYISHSYPNQYEMAIRAVLDICEHYNRTKYFEATGFGAKIPPQFAVSHMFPLNLATFDRFTSGVTGVLEAYKIALMNTQLYGPTNFAPTINEFANKAKQFPPDGSRYQVLLIITDGIITDMEKTKAAIISASDLPISIIIVGVGAEHFDKMDELDCDSGLLSQNGRSAKRDIVQFVPFRNFMTTPINGNINDEQQAHVQSLLAKEVLAEVPEQVTSYMKSKRIAPLEGNFSVNPDTSGGPSLNTAANYMPRIGQSSYPPSGPHPPSAPQQSAIPYPTNNYYPNIGGPAVVDPGVLADGLRTNLHLHSSAPPPSS